MEEIEKEMNQVITKVIEKIAEQYLEKLIDYIDKYVYEPKKPKKYKRTYEFMDSFQKLPQAKIKMSEIIQEIYFDSSKLTYKQQSSGLWQHGVEGENYTKRMAEILNDSELNKQYSQVEGGLNIGKNGYYWEEFLKYIKENIVKDVQAEFKRNGVILN